MTTPLQRRILSLLIIEPGARAGLLQARVAESRWNPKPTTNGITRSLTHLVARGLVRRHVVPGVDAQVWRYTLTDKGQLEAVTPPRRKVA